MVLEPNFVNLGVLQVNTVNNNSTISIGDNTSGDTLLATKYNFGFGEIYGSANFIPASLNCVTDPDVLDQGVPQSQFRPSAGLGL